MNEDIEKSLRDILKAHDGESTEDAARRVMNFIIKSKEVSWKEGEGIKARFGGEAVMVWAECMAECLRQSKAANCVEITVDHAELGTLVATIQRKDGKTPMELRGEAESRACIAKEALREVCDVSNIIPASARSALDATNVTCPHKSQNDVLRDELYATTTALRISESEVSSAWDAIRDRIVAARSLADEAQDLLSALCAIRGRLDECGCDTFDDLCSKCAAATRTDHAIRRFREKDGKVSVDDAARRSTAPEATQDRQDP